jgi:hypothetical protein
MMSDKERFDKVLAVAINPGAYEGEAIAAFRKARELAKKNRSSSNRHPVKSEECWKFSRRSYPLKVGV